MDQSVDLASYKLDFTIFSQCGGKLPEKSFEGIPDQLRSIIELATNIMYYKEQPMIIDQELEDAMPTGSNHDENIGKLFNILFLTYEERRRGACANLNMYVVKFNIMIKSLDTISVKYLKDIFADNFSFWNKNIDNIKQEADYDNISNIIEHCANDDNEPSLP